MNTRNSIESGIYWGLALFSILLLTLVFFITSMDQPGRRNTIIKMTEIASVEEKNNDSPQLYSADSFISNGYSSRQPVHVNETTSKAVKRTIKPSKELIPINYTELIVPGINVPIYLFIDNEGKTQARICVEKEYGGRRNVGFVEVYQTIKGTKIQYEYDLEDDFINTKEEKYGEIVPEEPETVINSNLINVYGIKGLYYLKNGNQKIYYIYGRYPNRPPCFFLANEHGEIVPGILPVEIKGGE